MFSEQDPLLGLVCEGAAANNKCCKATAGVLIVFVMYARFLHDVPLYSKAIFVMLELFVMVGLTIFLNTPKSFPTDPTTKIMLLI